MQKLSQEWLSVLFMHQLNKILRKIEIMFLEDCRFTLSILFPCIFIGAGKKKKNQNPLISVNTAKHLKKLYL